MSNTKGAKTAGYSDNFAISRAFVLYQMDSGDGVQVHRVGTTEKGLSRVCLGDMKACQRGPVR